MKKAVCVISGGMDSVLCAYIAKQEKYEIIALHFDYNQRTMNKERECFNNICDDLKVSKKYIINVDFISEITTNALTDRNIDVPKSGVDTKLPITYVSYRNGIFLSIAASLAEKENCDSIFIGVVQEDSSGYPDCTEEFIKSIEKSINLGTSKDFNVQIKTPLIHLSKKDIVLKANSLNVPLELTWSCYENEIEACGVCDSCRLRLKGFKLANLKDKIKYTSTKI